MAKSSAKSAPRTSMTLSAASRIQGATARVNGGRVSSGSFAARAQAGAAKNANRDTNGKVGSN